MIGIVCQLCGKRQATTHLTELGEGGQRHELHCCATCIEQLDLKLESGPPPIAEILALQAKATGTTGTEATVDQPIETGIEVDAEEMAEACAGCGLTFAEFAVNNRFGCARCYSEFGEKVQTLLHRYHGSGLHVGRFPQTTRPNDREQARRRVQLDSALRDAIAAEAYEKAALLRDEIRRLDDAS